MKYSSWIPKKIFIPCRPQWFWLHMLYALGNKGGDATVEFLYFDFFKFLLLSHLSLMSLPMKSCMICLVFSGELLAEVSKSITFVLLPTTAITNSPGSPRIFYKNSDFFAHKWYILHFMLTVLVFCDDLLPGPNSACKIICMLCKIFFFFKISK